MYRLRQLWALVNAPARRLEVWFYLYLALMVGVPWAQTEIFGGGAAGTAIYANVKKDFGAIGDGVTDDTAAIRRAVNPSGHASDGTMPGRRVFFPAGLYKVTGTIEIPPNVSLFGVGRYSTNSSATDVTASTIACALNDVCLRIVRRNASPGNLFHMGGVEDLSFTGPDSLGITSTTATRIIELGDSTLVNTSNGAWDVYVRRCTINNVLGGYGIYSAHSQEAVIDWNWINQVKFPIYYGTVVSTARISRNTILDQSAIANAIGMQFRPGTLGGSSGGPHIFQNYLLGFQYAIWNTSINGINIRDNVFEGQYQTSIYNTAFLPDQITQDGSGPSSGVISGNTFINWGASAVNTPAIQLSYTKGFSIDTNSYQSPNGAVLAIIGWFDNGGVPQATQHNIIQEPFCTGNNCGTALPFPASSTITGQNVILGRQFIKPQVVAGDLSFAAFTGGDNGKFWWNNTAQKFTYWTDQTIHGIAENTRIDPTYSASIAIDAALGSHFRITATNGSAFTVNNPTNGFQGKRITIQIVNSSGGALGAITFGGNLRLAGAFIAPGNGANRSIEFVNDSGSGNVWYEVSRTAADVTN